MSISTEGLSLKIPDQIHLFERFGPDHNRFSFPGPVYRVTGGHGGEALLIAGSDKTALIDCGMAYCGQETVKNTRAILDRTRHNLDYIFLSHSHYDHIGALPAFRRAFPSAKVLGSEHCAGVLERPGAKKLIKELGENARNKYAPGSDVEISTMGFYVDKVLEDGESVSLGTSGGEPMSIQGILTPGHTDCSMSYYLKPFGLLFTSESTGILEGRDYLHTPCLKSFIQGLDSTEKCRNLGAKSLCLPHFGMVPDGFLPEFWGMFEEECRSKTSFVSQMMAEGLTEEEMLQRYMDRYWTDEKAMEQPKEAFELNSGYILKTLIRENGELKRRFGM